MPGSIAYQTAHLDPPNGDVIAQPYRLPLGGALYALCDQLRGGASAANAQAYVAAVPRHVDAINDAQTKYGGTVSSDFLAITTIL